jgi:hypothetical protein
MSPATTTTDSYEDEHNWSRRGSENTNQEQLQFCEWELKSTILSDRKAAAPTRLDQDDDQSEENTMSSVVDINHFPLAISCSYNGRFAVAYKKAPESDQVFVEIYECESTGGSGWKLEDVLYLESPVLPKIKIGINFDYIYGAQKPIRPAHSSHSFKNILLNQYNHNAATSNLNSTDDSEIPSAAIRHSIKQKFLDKDSCRWCHDVDADVMSSHSDSSNASLVKIDWASTESGSHILMVCLANQVYIYNCVKAKKLATGNVTTKAITGYNVVQSPPISKSSSMNSVNNSMRPGHILQEENIGIFLMLIKGVLTLSLPLTKDRV